MTEVVRYDRLDVKDKTRAQKAWRTFARAYGEMNWPDDARSGQSVNDWLSEVIGGAALDLAALRYVRTLVELKLIDPYQAMLGYDFLWETHPANLYDELQG